MRFGIYFLLATIFGGCSKKGHKSYFPLVQGNKWVYTVRSGFQVRLDTLRVVRENSINGLIGWDIQGPGGITSLYWFDDILKMKYTPNLQAYPAIPLLDVSKKEAQMVWKGCVVFEGKKTPATGVLKQSPDRYQEGSKFFDCLKSHLTLCINNKTLELLSWFHKGTGIICQQQRTNNYLDISLEYLTGP